MGRLSGKTALVTGGTTGIGYASAKLFLAEGARVAITGQNPERLAAAAASLGPDVIGILADAGKVAGAQLVADRVKEAFGQLDIAYLNAGIAQFAPAADTSEALFDSTFGVNVKGVLFGAQALFPVLREGASVIITGSIAGLIGLANTAVYSASKAAVRNLARTLAGELAPRRIRVNTISPGPIITPIFDKTGIDDAAKQDMIAGMAAKIPLGRLGQPEEIGYTALFLASDESSFITGAEIVVDGGWTQIGA